MQINYQQLNSKIDRVKLYAAGATVSRVAELADRNEVVEIPGLPLALDDSTVRVRVESGSGNSAFAAIATDVRIGLGVPPQTETQAFPPEAEISTARTEVQQLEELLTVIDHEIKVISRIEIPQRLIGEGEKAPPPSPTMMRMAIANYKNQQIRDRMQEQREIREKLRQAQENLNDLLEKQSRASSAKEARPHELRKLAIIRLTYPEIDSNQPLSCQRLILEYFVPGTRWTPTYICRLDTVANTATIAMRALICQKTGEDWNGVSLELSTAEPMMWCDLPELPSLRLGRAQPTPQKSGWRLPPVGAELLFEDYDRDRQKQPLFNEEEEEKDSLNQVLDDILQSLSSDSSDSDNLDMLFEDSMPSQDLEYELFPPRDPSYASQRWGIVTQDNFSPFVNNLVASGYIDSNRMNEALKQSRQLQKPLPEVLENMTNRKLSPKWLRLYKLQRLFELKVIYAVESLDLKSAEIPAEQIIDLMENLIPIEICRLHRILPLYKTKANPPSLVVGMVDPDKLDALDDLHRMLKPHSLGFQRRVITLEDYQHFLTLYLQEKQAEEAARKKQKQDKANQVDLCLDPNAFASVELEEVGIMTDDNFDDLELVDLCLDPNAFASVELQEVGIMTDDNFDDLELQEVGITTDDDLDLNKSLRGGYSLPVVKTVNQILAKALSDRVSDIHVEPQQEGVRVLMRKDGVLKEVYKLPLEFRSPLVARFKIIADLDIAQHQQIQEGQFQRIFQGETMYFALCCLPTQFGEKILIQICKNFNSGKSLINFDKNLSLILAYNMMELGAEYDIEKRGKLSIMQPQKTYLEILKRQDIDVNFNVMFTVQEAIIKAKECLNQPLPFGGIDVRQLAGYFDYVYRGEGRVDVPSYGEFHSVALTGEGTEMDIYYVTVPREAAHVFRMAKLLNPLPSPLLTGPTDVYLDGEYLLSTTIKTVPPKGEMDLGLGVEESIKVARNATYKENRGGNLLVGVNELHHEIKIDLVNHLSKDAKIEVRDRVPIPAKDAKVDVSIDAVSPPWEKYPQTERDLPIQGGYHWWVNLSPGEEKTLAVQYTLKIAGDRELIGGNRREE